jgi:hypothetical protein
LHKAEIDGEFTKRSNGTSLLGVIFQPTKRSDGTKKAKSVRQLADTSLVEISQNIDFYVPSERLVT